MSIFVFTEIIIDWSILKLKFYLLKMDEIQLFSIKGRRPYMEDTYSLYEDNDFSYYAVFDGHGGCEISNQLKKYLFMDIYAGISSIINKDDIYAVGKNIRDIIIRFDEKLYLKNKNSTVGSTGIILIRVDNQIYVANLGDSRAIIYKNNELLIETIDHKPDKEIKRIEESGGRVIFGRVNGLLGVSRAFGDFEYKFIYNKYNGKNAAVSCVPDIYTMDLLETGPVTAVLASDGLWDILTAHDIMKIPQDKNFCKNLVTTAYNKNSQDNITAISISFRSR